MSEQGSFFDELASTALQSGAPVLDVVAAMIDGQGPDERLRVVELGAQMATLVSRSGRAIRIFRAPGQPQALGELIDQLAAHNPRTGSEVVIVGGGQAETDAITEAIPRLLRHPFVVFQRTSSGDVRAFPPAKGAKSPRLRALQNVRSLTEPERRGLLETVQTHAQSLQQEQKERARFFRGMNTRAPVATYGLLGLIGVVFLLQNLWGPKGGILEENVFFLAMGALHPPLVEQEGQWYRLISVGFLHGGVMHVAVNSFVLYLLGGQMERVLGTVRFILLYTVALVGGAFASYQFLGNGLSVGASGAVWGLLGAQVALAYGKPPVLPKSVAESIKPLARQNILLNVGISFIPGIDAAAHFGGGIAGALLLASGVLYRKSDRAGPDGGPPSQRPIRGLPAGLPIVAVLCVVLLLWGIVTALLEGRPWDADQLAKIVAEIRNS